MIARTIIVAPLIVVAGLGICFGIQRNVDAHRPQLPGYDPTDPAFDSDLLYVPNDKLLNHFTGGMSTLAADLLWLKCVQYTAKHFGGDGKFVWLEHMARTITRLDPYFVPAYRHAGIFMAALKGDDDSSIRLMQSGIVQNPEAWELPYEIAMVYLLNRRDDPLSPEMAGQYLSLAVSMGTAPESVNAIAQGLMMKHSLNDIERNMWQDVRDKSDDAFERAMAERKLTELTLRENCEALDKAVEVYRQAKGGAPKRAPLCRRADVEISWRRVRSASGCRRRIH